MTDQAYATLERATGADKIGPECFDFGCFRETVAGSLEHSTQQHASLYKCISGAIVGAIVGESAVENPSLPVCLSENSHRLVSLWELMNQFDASRAMMLHAKLERVCSSSEQSDNENIGANPKFPIALKVIKDVIEFCDLHKFETCSDVAQLALMQLESDTRTSIIESEFRHVGHMFARDVNKRKFLLVTSGLDGYVDTQKWIGETVYENFPSARYDIKEAGNCIAVECSTAAVFHLMRVAEIGLRSLAFDRNIAIPKDVPIPLATWDQIIIELEKAECAIQQYPKTVARESQFEFYHGANMEFKRFKNLFRNRVVHVRENYDQVQALGAMWHVQTFMRILAGKLREGERTPEIWSVA